jgi:hypothetical protein
MLKSAGLFMCLASLAAPAAAQQMQHGTQTPGATRTEPPTSQMPGHAGMDMVRMSMQGMLGSYPMRRDGSGTSWQPEATPPAGRMAMRGDWMTMTDGFVYLIADRQTGPRGDDKVFAQSMAMLMGQRRLGGGTLGLRGMVSLDPAAIGRRGYPLLGQTGETADGVTPLVDRQHPHDFFMELAASYSLPLGQSSSVFVYGGPVGEPALGPSAFMHRYSARRNPEAPLTHHWFDSSHITFGVVTVGGTLGPLKAEASAFNGREPDQSRWNIETRKFDSWSTRLTFNPTAKWSLQVSYGDLKRPEQLEPDTDIRRSTVSASYHRRLPLGEWQTTLAWGRNEKREPSETKKLDGWLLESTLAIAERHTVFTRLEQVNNDELIDGGSPLAGQAFRVRKATLGYVYDFAKIGPATLGVGGLAGVIRVPSALDAVYGGSPRSYMAFLQARL